METLTKIEQVERLIDRQKYQEAANLALKLAGARIERRLIDTKRPAWDDMPKAYRPHYNVVIFTPNGSMSFDFWDSINAGKELKQWEFRQPTRAAKPQPTNYDIIACLQWYEPGTFTDFCGNFGYDEDSRKAYATWEAVVKQYADLVAAFPSEEDREMFSRIQ